MTLNDLTIQRLAEQMGKTPDELRDMIAMLDGAGPEGPFTTRHFDRQGQPMTFGEWAVAFEVDRVVKQTLLDNDLMISTIWLGLDHGWPGSDPVIFETGVMVPAKFEWHGEMRDGLDDLEMERFTNEAAALVAHDELVAKWADVGVSVRESYEADE